MCRTTSIRSATVVAYFAECATCGDRTHLSLDPDEVRARLDAHREDGVSMNGACPDAGALADRLVWWQARNRGRLTDEQQAVLSAAAAILSHPM